MWCGCCNLCLVSSVSTDCGNISMIESLCHKLKKREKPLNLPSVGRQYY